MKIIDYNKISSLGISPKQCLLWVEEAFKLKYVSDLPPKISMKMDGNIFFNTMPCNIPSVNKFGVKEVSRFPSRIPSLISTLLLYDSKSGDLLSLMDGSWITAMRTGAVAALAINNLQRKDAEFYSFIGLGNTARATLLCLLNSNPSKMYHVNLLAYKNQAELFIKRFEDYKNVSFTVINSIPELVSQSDVIVSCVTAMDGIFADDSLYKEGVLVVPVHTRGFQNCDLFFDKVFVDDIAHVKGFRFFDKFKYVEEISKVLLKDVNGRSTERERIIAYNIGIALHDVYFASKIYEMIGDDVEDVNVFYENGKFWV